MKDYYQRLVKQVKPFHILQAIFMLIVVTGLIYWMVRG